MPRTQEVEISDEQLGQAFADTEAEIFNEAMGDADPENDGDRSLEQMEDLDGGQLSDDGEPEDEEPEDEEADAESDEDEEEAEDEDDEQDDVDEEEDRVNGQQLRDERRIPPARLREEAEARRAAMRENQELRERIARLEGAQQAKPQQQEQQREEIPDPVLDPEGFRRAVQEDAMRQARAAIEQDRMVRVNEQLNAAAQGDNGWKVKAAIDHISSTLDPRNPEHAKIVQGLVYSADPVRALISHWEKNGGREQEDALFRRLAEERGYRVPRSEREPARRQSQSQRRVAREDVSPRNVTRVPKSLNSAGGHGRRVQVQDPDLYDNSEASIFEYAFK